jgi:hypothetical protein
LSKEKKEEKPVYTDEQFAERAGILQPLIGQVVAYFDEGWRYGRLFVISENQKTAGITPIKSRYATAKPDDIFLSIMDVKPNDFAPALGGGGFILSPGGVKTDINPFGPGTPNTLGAERRKQEAIAKAKTNVDLSILTHMPAPMPPATERTINFEPSRVVELFKQGMKVQDIACAMGYAKGQGNNRTKAVLKKAGLL